MTAPVPGVSRRRRPGRDSRCGSAPERGSTPARSPTPAAAASARGGLALGGGGLGVVGARRLPRCSRCSSGGGGLGQLGTLDQQQVGQGDTPSEISSECRTGADANQRAGLPHRRRREQRAEVLGRRRSRRAASSTRYVDTVFFNGQTQTGCGSRDSQVGPFYCPARQARLHRPRLLRRARARSSASTTAPFVRGVRDRARVRAPRPGSARRAEEHRRRHAGAREQGGALGAPGRLLRGRLGRARRRHRADRAADAGRHQPGPRRRRRDRRRPHPGADAGPGEPARRGRTARRSSAAAGSRAATRTASPPPATRSRARSKPELRAPRRPQTRAGRRRRAAEPDPPAPTIRPAAPDFTPPAGSRPPVVHAG